MAALTKPFSYDEILSAIQQMRKGKSPRPDGFNAEFYLAFWDTIKHSLLKAFIQFQERGTILAWGRTYLVFIPKKF